MSVTFLPDHADATRVAFSVGRQVGGAVARNRLRRRLRAIATDAAPHLPTGAYMIGAAPSAAALAHPELQRLVTQTMEEASR